MSDDFDDIVGENPPYDPLFRDDRSLGIALANLADFLDGEPVDDDPDFDVSHEVAQRLRQLSAFLLAGRDIEVFRPPGDA